MTDEGSPTGRVELGALDAAADAARDEVVIRAVLQRIAATPQRDAELARLLRLRRAILAMAAVLAALAVGIARQLPRGQAGTPAYTVAVWIDAGHVPTNGELLAALQEGER